MSGLRQAIKSRFKSLGERSQDHTSEDDTMKEEASVTEMKSMMNGSGEKQNTSEENASVEKISLGSDCLPATDDIQEMPVDQLQEQLVSVMIQNQELERSLQEQDRIRKLYEHEKKKCKALEEQLREFVRQTSLRNASRHETPEGFIDVAQEVQEELDMAAEVHKNKTWRDRLKRWFMTSFHDLIQDFTDEPDVEENKHDKQLAIKTLKTNITRFKDGTHPIFYTMRGFRNLFAWESPTSTVVVFIMYMYAVWTGWLLPFVLLLIITRLSFNYLHKKGFHVNVNLLAPYESAETDNSENFSDMGVSDKFTVVVQVATKVQNELGYLADNLEKLWNLLTWQQSEATIQLYVALCGAFIMSCLLPGTTYFKIAALYLGFKMFIIEFIYLRFPRFKQRHDSVDIVWRNLPTNAQLKDQLHRQTICRKSIEREVTVRSGSTSSTESTISEDLKQFCDIFSLPHTEIPLKGWHDGKGCALLDKERGLSLKTFKYGKLFLTKSFVCFERQRKQSPKNITIALKDITDIKKAKPFSWLPGSGMSIEISTIMTDKPYIFGAMMSRDEVVDSIIAHALAADLDWASAAWESRDVISKSHGHKGSRDSINKVGDDDSLKDPEENEHEEKETELRQRSFRMSDLQCESDDE